MVGQIGPLVQVGRRRTALGLHVLGGVAGGATIGVLLGFAGLLLRAALGGTLDTLFVVAVPAALVVPLAALLVGDLAKAVAITAAYGAARALAVVVAVSTAGDDFAAACDSSQT